MTQPPYDQPPPYNQPYNQPPKFSQPPAKKRGRGAIITGIALTVLGLLVGIGSSVALVSSGSGIVKAIKDAPMTTPVDTTLDLSAKRYVVYELFGQGTTHLAAGDISVTGPDGAQIAVSPATGTQTLTRNSDQFGSVAEFTAPSAGSYHIVIPATERHELLLAAPVGSLLGGVFLGVGGLVVGGLLFVIGIIVLIIGIVLRNRRPTPRGNPAPY